MSLLIYNEVSSDFKDITLLSSDNINNIYPVMIVSKDDSVFSTHVVSGTQTINGVTYTTTPNALDLNFQFTLTTSTPKYYFTLNETSTTKVISDGIYTVDFIAADGSTYTEYVLVYKNIECCLAKSVSKKECNLSHLETITKIFALVESLKASLRIKDLLHAECKYQMLLNFCKNNCGC